MRNKFINPATAEEYVWPRNHLDEEQGERTRNVGEQHPTAAPWRYVKPVLQQGRSTTLVMRLTGRISDPNQDEVFKAFWRLTQRQTIHFQHCQGGLYEVVIARYDPTRVGAVDTDTHLRNIWTYTMELEVVSQLEE